MKRKGFTILELIITIIIAGVLSSLALVRFVALVEYSRSMEALSTMGVIRKAMDRCWGTSGQDYGNCIVPPDPLAYLMIDILF